MRCGLCIDEHNPAAAAAPPPLPFIWVRNYAGGDLFRVYLTDLDVDGLKKAIKAELGTDYTGNAPAIKIYDHQGQAMEHPEQAVSVNTSDTPFLYSLPAPSTIEKIGDLFSLLSKSVRAANPGEPIGAARRFPKVLADLGVASGVVNMGPTACSLIEGFKRLLSNGGSEDQSQIPLLTITGVSGQGKTEALQSILYDDAVEVESITARYSEHIKALFASPSGRTANTPHWTQARCVVRVFATYNQGSSYAEEVETNIEGSLSLRLLCSYYTGELASVPRQTCTISLESALQHIREEKGGANPQEVAIVVLIDELRKVVPYKKRKVLLNALTRLQQNFVKKYVPTFFVVSCVELNAVYSVVCTKSKRLLHAVPLFPCPGENLLALQKKLHEKLRTERERRKLRSLIFQSAGHYRTLEEIAACVLKELPLESVVASLGCGDEGHFNALLLALLIAFRGEHVAETTKLQYESDVAGATLFELANARLVLYEEVETNGNGIKPTVLPQALRCKTGVTISSPFLQKAAALCAAIRDNSTLSREETRKLWEQFVPLVELLKAALLLRKLKQNSGGAVRLCGGVYPANGLAVMGWDGQPACLEQRVELRHILPC